MNDSSILNQLMCQERLSRANLADILHVSVQFIGKIINGEKKLSNEKKSLLKSLFPSYFPAIVVDIPSTFTKENIAEIRNKLGYSQGEFAKLIGVSRSCVNKYENGERNISFAVETKVKSLLEQELNSSPKLYNISYAPDIKLSHSYSPKTNYVRHVQIDAELLKEVSPNDCVILTLGDDSLYPIYEPTDMVILDTSVNHFIDGSIFAFVHNGVTYIRKIYLLPDKIKCIPLNDKLDTFYLSFSDRYDIYGIIVPRFRL